MRLSPRYGDVPLIAIEERAEGPHPVVAQRRRLEATLAALDDEEWSAPSRCAGWSAQDVITHLESTNRFWALSVAQGLAGEPTRFLATFDPVATPAQMVEGTRGTPPAATLEAFRSSNAALFDALEPLDAAGWATLAEGPPGHLPISHVMDHALWDSWVHERDVLLPLGLDVVEDPAEVVTCLRYAAALGPAFGVQHGGAPDGAAGLATTDLELRLVVTVSDRQVQVADGDAPAGSPSVALPSVLLLEMLSRRDAGQAEPAELAWFTAGLSEVFDEGAPTR